MGGVNWIESDDEFFFFSKGNNLKKRQPAENPKPKRRWEEKEEELLRRAQATEQMKKNRSRKTLRRVYSLTNCSDIFKGIGEATLYKKKKKKTTIGKQPLAAAAWPWTAKSNPMYAFDMLIFLFGRR